MDMETIRLLTNHVEEHEPTVALVVSEIAAALAAHAAIDLTTFKRDIHERAERQPEARPCLEKLLEDLERLQKTGVGRSE